MQVASEYVPDMCSFHQQPQTKIITLHILHCYPLANPGDHFPSTMHAKVHLSGYGRQSTAIRKALTQ
jgi:hypothetical protein